MPHLNRSILPVTVAIPVKNEGANLARCLARLERFSEIVVIDSGSTDRTCAIAREHGARVIDFQWDGKFPKKRNWFLMNHHPKYEWVLFLDADEFVGDNFCDALQAELPGSDKSGYWITYDNFFLGKPLRRGIAQRKMALLRVGKAMFERIEEDAWSQLDMEIHEHPIVEGEVGQIQASIEHRDDRGLAHFVTKHRDYAQWEAKRFAKMQGDELVWTTLTGRQRFKYRHINKWWFPYFYFLTTYFVKLGFLDGSTGFHYAAYKTWYFQTIRLLILENLAVNNAEG